MQPGDADGKPVDAAAAPTGEGAQPPADDAATPDEVGQDPADAGASPPSDGDQEPAGVSAPAPNEGDQKPAESAATPPSDAATPPVAAEPAPADPVVVAIRAKLAEPALHKSADLGDLQAFYAERSGSPLWITGMGFSARAQAVISEIQNADDWGLAADAFELPAAADLPATTEAQATDEVKLDLAILQYARFARGGRLSPSRISVLLDQRPELRGSKTVLNEIGAAPAPDAYLRSLHPKQVQFERLRQALIKARAKGKNGVNGPDIQRLIVNMERWRWMPAELGSYHVEDNIPEFIGRVVKNGKTVYAMKVVVGLPKYATPIFSADMRSIVFNPEWVVPETIKLEDLQPSLRGGGFLGADTSILRDHELTVSYQGKSVDAEKVDWSHANILQYTFTQPPGPDNVLGTLKFNFPNKHAIYMHDTIQPEVFDETVRMASHGCIRVYEPARLAALLLAEDKGWSAQQVKDMLAKGNNSVVSLSHKVPVHVTYFTATVDEKGKVQAFADIYGLDSKMGSALFGKATKFDAVATEEAAAGGGRKRSAWNSGRGGLTDAINGLFGN